MKKKVKAVTEAVVSISFSDDPPPTPPAGKLQAVSAAAAQAAATPPAVLDGHYFVETKGKTAQEVMDAIDAKSKYHAEKSRKITGMSWILGSTLGVGTETYKYIDCTVRERGTDVELYVAVADSKGQPQSPLIIVRPTIAELPGVAELSSMMANEISNRKAVASVDADRTTELQRLLGEA